jgi:hypothetical protein
LIIFFSRTTGPILTRPGLNQPWGKEIQISSNEGIAFLEGEVIAKE